MSEPKRYPANGQSGGRGADVWVILGGDQVAWLKRNVGASLTAMSEAGEVVRISNFPRNEQTVLLPAAHTEESGPPPQETDPQ